MERGYLQSNPSGDPPPPGPSPRYGGCPAPWACSWPSGPGILHQCAYFGILSTCMYVVIHQGCIFWPGTRLPGQPSKKIFSSNAQHKPIFVIIFFASSIYILPFTFDYLFINSLYIFSLSCSSFKQFFFKKWSRLTPPPRGKVFSEMQNPERSFHFDVVCCISRQRVNQLQYLQISGVLGKYTILQKTRYRKFCALHYAIDTCVGCAQIAPCDWQVQDTIQNLTFFVPTFLSI